MIARLLCDLAGVYETSIVAQANVKAQKNTENEVKTLTPAV